MLWVLILLAATSSFASKGAFSQAVHSERLSGESRALEPLERRLESVVVRVDPRIELMTVIQLLFDYLPLSEFESPYRIDALAYFEDHRSHPAVGMMEAMAERGFAFDIVPKSFLSMTLPPGVRLTDEPSDEVIGRAGVEALRELAGRVGDFATASDFAAFYRAHRGTYEAILDRNLPTIAAAVDELEGYLGTSLGSARVVLGPLLHDGGFAAVGYEVQAQALIGPEAVGEQGILDFGDRERLGSLIWHEFSHTVVNDLTAGHAATVAELSEAFEQYDRDLMKRQGYTAWPTVVNESVIRAIEVRLAAEVLGSEAASRELSQQRARGFLHVPALSRELEEYEAARDRYPTLGDFYPRLLRVFELDPEG